MASIPSKSNPYHGTRGPFPNGVPDINLATAASATHVQVDDALNADFPMGDDPANIYFEIPDNLSAIASTRFVDNLYDRLDLLSL